MMHRTTFASLAAAGLMALTAVACQADDPEEPTGDEMEEESMDDESMDDESMDDES